MIKSRRYLAWFFIKSVDGELWLLEKTIEGFPIEPSKGMRIALDPLGQMDFVIETIKVNLSNGEIELQLSDEVWQSKATCNEIEKYIAEYYGDWEVVDFPGKAH